MVTAQAGKAGLSRTSASAPLLPARTPFEPAPIRNPGPTFQPATQSNLILGQTRAGKLLLHNNRTCADAICCAADSNQRHLLVDALPFEPSLGPNRAVVRWLIWALERSAAHERVPSGRATMPLMHPMMSVDPSEGARRAQCPPGLHFSASAQRRTGLYPDARHSNACVLKKVRFECGYTRGLFLSTLVASGVKPPEACAATNDTAQEREFAVAPRR